MTPQEMPTTIEQKHVLLVEGSDEKNFFDALKRELELSEVQVLPFAGKTQFRTRLGALKRTPGFQNVISLGIVRDANDNPEAAIQSVRDALRANGLPIPRRPLTPEGSNPRVTFMILPCEKGKGSLEDLCLKALVQHPAMTCVEQYFQCLQEQGLPAPHEMSKAKIHAFLASRERAHRRLGEAAQAGDFDWTSQAFDEVKDFLRQLGTDWAKPQSTRY